MGLVYVVPLFILLFFAPVSGRLHFVAILVFQMYLLSKDGQTIGKKVMDTRIVKVDTGENGGFVTNVLVRTILNGLIGIIPLYGLIDILFIFRGDKRCIHDLIAGTKVVA